MPPNPASNVTSGVPGVAGIPMPRRLPHHTWPKAAHTDDATTAAPTALIATHHTLVREIGIARQRYHAESDTGTASRLSGTAKASACVTLTPNIVRVSNAMSPPASAQPTMWSCRRSVTTCLPRPPRWS